MGQWMMLVLSRRYSTLPALTSLTALATSGVTVPALGVGHQALGAEDLTETADNAHHVGGSDDDVEIEPVFLLDLLDHVHLADVIGASLAGSVRLVALGEDENARGLTGTVGQDDRAADLLVGVTGVNAQLDVQLDGLVELRRKRSCRSGRSPLRRHTAYSFRSAWQHPDTFYL